MDVDYDTNHDKGVSLINTRKRKETEDESYTPLVAEVSTNIILSQLYSISPEMIAYEELIIDEDEMVPWAHTTTDTNQYKRQIQE